MSLDRVLSAQPDSHSNLMTKEAARILRVSHRTLEDWRLTGTGPRFAKLNRRVVYRRQDLLAFLDERMRLNTGGGMQ